MQREIISQFNLTYEVNIYKYLLSFVRYSYLHNTLLSYGIDKWNKDKKVSIRT